jgi:hypothetical protein
MFNDSNHFYITLFSTASQKLFPDNTHAAFTNELAQTIDLDPKDKWEVGLCEFTCPPHTAGTVKPLMVVGHNNSPIYCNLIQPQFVGNNLISLSF